MYNRKSIERVTFWLVSKETGHAICFRNNHRFITKPSYIVLTKLKFQRCSCWLLWLYCQLCTPEVNPVNGIPRVFFMFVIQGQHFQMLVPTFNLNHHLFSRHINKWSVLHKCLLFTANSDFAMLLQGE